MRKGQKIVAGIGIFAVVGTLLLIASGQMDFGEAMVLIIVLIFILPGLSNILL